MPQEPVSPSLVPEAGETQNGRWDLECGVAVVDRRLWGGEQFPGRGVHSHVPGIPAQTFPTCTHPTLTKTELTPKGRN